MSLPSLSTKDYGWTFCNSPFPSGLSFPSKSNLTVAKRKIPGRKDTKHDLNWASPMQGQPWFVLHSRFLKCGQSETEATGSNAHKCREVWLHLLTNNPSYFIRIFSLEQRTERDPEYKLGRKSQDQRKVGEHLPILVPLRITSSLNYDFCILKGYIRKGLTLSKYLTKPF